MTRKYVPSSATSFFHLTFSFFKNCIDITYQIATGTQTNLSDAIMSSSNVFRIYSMIVVIASISLPSVSILIDEVTTSNVVDIGYENNQEQYEIISINETSSRNEEVVQTEDRKKKDRSFNPNSTTIRNDVKWLDDRGMQLDTTRGGEISKIDGVFYWVGTRPYTHKNVSYNLYFIHYNLQNTDSRAET